MGKEKVKQLNKLFVSRVKSYDNYTSKIKKMIGGALKGIEAYIRTDLLQPAASVRWGAIQHIREHNALEVAAYVTWPIGTKVNTADGSSMKLTKANAGYFNMTLYLGLPMSLVFESKEKIISFLRSKEHEQHEEIREQMKTLFGTPETGNSFDMDSLTEEQQKALLSWNTEDEQNSRH